MCSRRSVSPVTTAALAVLVIAACGDPPPSEYPTQTTFIEDTTLGPGDVIDVRVFYGSKDIVRSYRIGHHGIIAFPHIGELKVVGKTQEAVEEEIRSLLADGYLKNPIVSVDIKESNSKKVAVFGQVRTPGTLSYFNGMTVVEAISQAGGFTAMARKNAVTVTRQEGEKKVKYTVPVSKIANNKAANFPMRPGDVLFVPERVF